MLAARYLFFAQTFDEGRQWFRDAVTAAGGVFHTYINPNGVTMEGAPLSTDVGWFGPVDASRLFISISGTHGVEYFCGAAGQLAWIADGGPKTLPPDVAVCLIHANNCYGSAWHSRGDENFVDPNRNYMDHSVEIRPNPLYSELFDILFTSAMDEHVLDDVMAAFYDFVDRSDPVEAMTAMGGGQRSHPSGTLYCGDKASWSTQNLQSLVTTLFAHSKWIALIDWHTGLGDFGKATVMNNMLADPVAADWARQWWRGAEPNADIAGSAQPLYVGNAVTGMAEDLRGRGATVAETVIELGTFANKGVLMALLIDRWLRFECLDRTAPHAVRFETKMVERLNPSNPEWREAVVAEMRRIYAQTIAGLAAWA